MTQDNDNGGALTVIGSDLQIVAPSALEALTRGEIDMQISTARRFPRSLRAFKANAIAMVQTDVETAESCIYSRPVGKGDDGKQKFAEGMSIRMAEIVCACFGNIRSGAMLVEVSERSVTARGFCHDLETNNFAQWEVREPTVKRNGQPYGESQRNVVAKAALAKAQRDAIFKVVPKALCRSFELEARKMVNGDAKSFEERRGNAVVWLQRLKIDLARVWAALDVAGPEELKGEHLVLLQGIRTAITDKETTIEEAFPPIAVEKPAGQTAGTATELAQQAAAPGSAGAAPGGATGGGGGTEPKPEEAKPPGPSPEALRKSLYAKAQAELNLTKKTLPVRLIEHGYLAEGASIDDLEASALADLLEGFAEFADKVRNPGATT